MAVEEAIDQMEIARTAAPGTNRKFSGEMGLCTGGKGRGFFMPGVDPFDVLANTQGFRQAI
ncbi:hypothetical protein D3C71_1800250 [compost metagenome]